MPLVVPEHGDGRRKLGLRVADTAGGVLGGVRRRVSHRLASLLDKRDQNRLMRPVRVWSTAALAYGLGGPKRGHLTIECSDHALGNLRTL